jgi:two-component system CheB/CheR fusion protein
MNLIPSDLGRPVTDIKTNLRIHDLRESVSRVVDTLEIHESEVEDTAGKRYSMRIRPYRTVDNKIDGVVVVLFELDSRPRLKQS